MRKIRLEVYWNLEGLELARPIVTNALRSNYSVLLLPDNVQNDFKKQFEQFKEERIALKQDPEYLRLKEKAKKYNDKFVAWKNEMFDKYGYKGTEKK